MPGLKGVYRLIEAGEGCTLDELHEAIYDAFDSNANEWNVAILAGIFRL